jgi:diadenosine tetraphosphate (Ap4A) HIT family hydrolase
MKYTSVMEDISKYLIKDYTYWLVSIAKDQGYLGRCLIWCKRETALDLADATLEEREELFAILSKLKQAIKEAFHADWFNYTFLGNETPHLHEHLIPRYKSDRDFEGYTFTDEQWGHNPYKGNKSQMTDPDIVEKVRLKLIEVLS